LIINKTIFVTTISAYRLTGRGQAVAPTDSNGNRG
jgi:hypothetical protein